MPINNLQKIKYRHPAEEAAFLFLRRCGHRLLRNNYHAKFCEIDLITLDEIFTVHFTEVKNWQSRSLLQHPLQTFNERRVELVYRAAQSYIAFAHKDFNSQKYLKDLNCPQTITQLSLSFNMLWLHSPIHIEYYPQIF